MSKIETDALEVSDVQYKSGFKLNLRFNDGRIRTVDFGPFLEKAQHPEIRKYLSLEKFMQFTFEHGYLHWNDYDMSFPLDDLYEGVIT